MTNLVYLTPGLVVNWSALALALLAELHTLCPYITCPSTSAYVTMLGVRVLRCQGAKVPRVYGRYICMAYFKILQICFKRNVSVDILQKCLLSKEFKC